MAARTADSEAFVEAAERYREHPMAMNLRAMNMLYESIAKRGSLMVVPSGLADSLNVPGMMGMASAARGALGVADPAHGGVAVADRRPEAGSMGADLPAR